MKLIPCPTCKLPAVGAKSEKFPDGIPVVMARFTGGMFPVIIPCQRCKRSFKLDPMTFNSLPLLSSDQLSKMGLA